MEMPAQSSIYSSENLNDKTVSIGGAKFSVNAKTCSEGPSSSEFYRWYQSILEEVPSTSSHGRLTTIKIVSDKDVWTIDKLWIGPRLITFMNRPPYIIRLQHILYTIILLNKWIYIYTRLAVYVYSTTWNRDLKRGGELGKAVHSICLRLSGSAGWLERPVWATCPWLFVSGHWFSLRLGHWKFWSNFLTLTLLQKALRNQLPLWLCHVPHLLFSCFSPCYVKHTKGV